MFIDRPRSLEGTGHRPARLIKLRICNNLDLTSAQGHWCSIMFIHTGRVKAKQLRGQPGLGGFGLENH